MAQPQRPPAPRQSQPPAKPAPTDALHQLAPGGPIKPLKQGFVNPGPTPDLRGVEPNTERHKGTPNPEQHGTHKNREDHSPGMGEAGNVHRPNVPEILAMTDRKHSAKGTPVAPPEPNPKGVRK